MTRPSLRLLVLASRPSDYGEMSELARGLSARGHYIHLLYFFAPGDPGSDLIVRSIETFNDTPRVMARGVDIDDVQRGQQQHDGTGNGAAAQLSQATEIGLYRMVQAFRDRYLGRAGVALIRRHLPTIRGIFPVVYKAARLVDMVRNLPAGIRMARETARDRIKQTRQMSVSMRLKVLMMGPKVVTDAAFMEQVYRRFLAFFAETIASNNIEALLIPEDIVGNLWPVAIKAGHDAGAPTLVLPYTLANKEEAFQSLKDQPSYQTKANQIAAIRYPRWRLAEGGHDLVRLPSAHIFAHERLGIAPPDPWMMNSGYAECICVDSQAAFDYFRAGGIPAEQMRVVGSVSQDAMAARRAGRAAHLQQLRADLQLSGEKPLLLISGCPNQLAATVPHCEFNSIGDVAAHVGRSLAPLTEHYHLVVRPHPNFPEFAAMLRPFGVASTMAPTFSLVPLASVFVAFASATIRWAIACGVPTVNYDVFHYGYGDFAGAKGVVSIQGGDDFERTVGALIPGSARMAALETAAAGDSAQWSMMDGRSLDRIEQEIIRARQQRAKAAS
jgi:hypothetical protein